MPLIKIWIHLIFSTKNREPYINKEVKTTILSHIRNNTKEKDIHIDSINAVLDHIHILFSLKSEQVISKVVQLIKGESSHWINKNDFFKTRFEWQDEYIAISVSESQVAKVREYIKNQEEHHKKRTFLEEYEKFLKNIDFYG